MKTIIIFYEHINREYDACVRLKDEIEKSNPDCKAYVYSIAFEYFKAIKTAKKNKIHIVIMPWLYTHIDYELVQPFIKLNPDVKIINLHHEQIGTKASEIVLLPRGEEEKNSVIHFVWGEYFRDRLLSIGVNESLIFITGNIRTDTAFKVSTNRKVLAKEFNLDEQKKWILFAENRGGVLMSSKKLDEFLLFRGYTKQDLIDRNNIYIQSLKSTIDDFNDLPESFFENYELIYRSHPGTIAPSDFNERIRIIDKYSIYEWINSIDVNVVWSSTTIFESDIKGVPSIIYEPIKNLERHKNFGLEEYPIISSMNEINKELIQHYNEHIKPKKTYEKYIGAVDGKSIKRANDIIEKILTEGIDGYKANKVKYNKGKMIKKYLFEKLTKILVRLGLLETLKYPNTAYKLKKDIPYKDTK